jgi:quinol monooxygenase YgiN
VETGEGSSVFTIPTTKENAMILATTKFADWDRFWTVFSTAGAEKRAEHGCKGALVFRDDEASDSVWVVFDWDDAGWKSFVTDPSVPPVMKDAGHLTKPYALQFHGAIEA